MTDLRRGSDYADKFKILDEFLERIEREISDGAEAFPDIAAKVLKQGSKVIALREKAEQEWFHSDEPSQN